MYTGHWIDGGYIYGPNESGRYWIEGGFIYGPKNSGKYWIEEGFIYGPKESGKFWIPNESGLKAVDYNHFGTRHRSMMRYCWNYPGSVGFVVYQDGDVRAMTKYDNKLIIWDNIKLQAYTFIRRRLRRRKKPSK